MKAVQATQPAQAELSEDLNEYSIEELKNILKDTTTEIKEINNENIALLSKREELVNDMGTIGMQCANLDAQMFGKIPPIWVEALSASESLEKWEQLKREQAMYIKQYQEIICVQEKEMQQNLEYIAESENSLKQMITIEQFNQHKINIGEIYRKKMDNYEIMKTPIGKLQMQLNAGIEALKKIGYNFNQSEKFQFSANEQCNGRSNSKGLIHQEKCNLELQLNQLTSAYSDMLNKINHKKNLEASLNELNIKLGDLKPEESNLKTEIFKQEQENQQKEKELKQKIEFTKGNTDESVIKSNFAKIESYLPQIDANSVKVFETLIHGGICNATGKENLKEIRRCHNFISSKKDLTSYLEQCIQFNDKAKKLLKSINDREEAMPKDRIEFIRHEHANMMIAMERQRERRYKFLVQLYTGHSEDQIESVNDEDQGYSKS